MTNTVNSNNPTSGKKPNPSKGEQPIHAYIAVGPPNEEIDARDAEIRAERQAKGYPSVEFVRDGDPLSKHIGERGDFLDQAYADPLLAPDPMREVAQPHEEPGMAYKFLSPSVCRQMGTRGYEIVKDAAGDPVALGNLKLGKIRKEIAVARQKKAVADSTERVKSMADEYGNTVSRLKRDARDLGLRVLEPGEMSGQFVNSETGRTLNIG